MSCETLFRNDAVPFAIRLAETIEWCGPRARLGDPRGCLRSEVLRPPLLEVGRAAIVGHVTAARAQERFRDRLSSQNVVQRLFELGVADPRPAQGLEGGRLLVYFPDGNLRDGAAESVSGGFFDIDNIPPWDTWVGYGEDPGPAGDGSAFLVCWIPPVFMDLAGVAIDVNPEQCIGWLDLRDLGTRRELVAFSPSFARGA